jgi:ATP-binding cassette subfamily B protein
MRAVLGFTFAHWAKQRGRATGIVVGISCATLTEIFVPVYAGRLVDALAGNIRAAALSAFGTMVGLGLAMVVLRHVAWMGVVPFTLRLMSDIAQDAFARVQKFSAEWHSNTFTGSTLRKITRGMWAIDLLNDTILMAIAPAVVVLVGTMFILAWHAPLLGVVMGIGATVYVTLTTFLATRWVAPAASLSNVWDTRMGGLLSDAITCNAIVKTCGAEAREETRLKRLIAKWSKRTYRTWARATWSATIQIALLWVLRTILVASALWLWLHGSATPGDITYVLTAFFVLQGWLRDIGQHVHNVQRCVNEMEELVALHDQPLDVEDRANAKPVRITAGEVTFDGVRFRYGGHQTPLYEDLSVTIRGGERVGLVGHSGSGKTTFVKLIQRLYDVTGGQVLIDGCDVRDATQQSLRAQIAVVQQEPILFHRSLAENIAYARPDASSTEIEHAAKLANAHDFIACLPQGYATLVGERGVKLSGGERQRVALARAFLADAPILILDEATSSLDSESEALIQEAIARLMKGRTAIIIAHRLSTVRNLDRILVFDRGRIVEDGDHDALLARPGGIYRRLFERQARSIRHEPLMIDDAPESLVAVP